MRKHIKIIITPNSTDVKFEGVTDSEKVMEFEKIVRVAAQSISFQKETWISTKDKKPADGAIVEVSHDGVVTEGMATFRQKKIIPKLFGGLAEVRNVFEYQSGDVYEYNFWR